MAYTYNDFLSELNRTGAKLSDADMATARKYPEFGISLLSLGEDFNKATTQEQKTLAHEAAEELRRSYGGYSGGTARGRYQLVPKADKQTSDALDRIGAVGSFTYEGTAPTYTNPYAKEQAALLDRVMDQEAFSWDRDNDPLWGSYKKSYLREGERASANALAQAAAATGGRPSTYAMTAAGQAGDYYAAQLNDIIPALEQQAYGRWQDEQNDLLARLSALNAQEQLSYAKYLDELGQYNTDRSFSLNQHLSEMDVLQAQLAAAQGQAATDYQKKLTEVERAAQRAQEERALAQGQVDAMLSAGAVPSAELTAAAGYSNEYVTALAAAVAASRNTGSGGGYDNGGLDEETIRTMQGLFGLEQDGKWGPNSQSMSGMSAQEAYAYLVSMGLIGQGGPAPEPEKEPVVDEYSGLASLSYDEDEGIFTWNGKAYTDLQKLLEALNKTELPPEVEQRLRDKFSMNGFDIK